MLFVVCEYFFTLIAYIFLYKDYGGNCESTLKCFLFTFDYTFKTNGGIGGKLEELTPRAGKFVSKKKELIYFN